MPDFRNTADARMRQEKKFSLRDFHDFVLKNRNVLCCPTEETRAASADLLTRLGDSGSTRLTIMRTSQRIILFIALLALSLAPAIAIAQSAKPTMKAIV